MAAMIEREREDAFGPEGGGGAGGRARERARREGGGGRGEGIFGGSRFVGF